MKSSQAELAALREEVFARDGGCVWPGCSYTPADLGRAYGTYPFNFYQLAHLTHRGIGGSAERNTPDNAVQLCVLHHDCLDGRTGLGILRAELNAMLRAVAGNGLEEN